MIDTFEERLRKIRLKLGLTRKAISEKLDISDSNYARYEYGRASPPYQFLSKLYEIYDVNIHWLLFETGDMFLSDEGNDGSGISDVQKENKRLKKMLKDIVDGGYGGATQADAASVAEIVSKLREIADQLEKLIIEKGG
ncbi:MAG: helix-turn-helix domain-containing protein [bacterium]